MPGVTDVYKLKQEDCYKFKARQNQHSTEIPTWRGSIPSTPTEKERMEEHNKGKGRRLEREASPKPAELQVFLSNQALQFLQQIIQLCTGSRLLRAGILHLCTGICGADAQITQELQGGPQGGLQIICGDTGHYNRSLLPKATFVWVGVGVEGGNGGRVGSSLTFQR